MLITAIGAAGSIMITAACFAGCALVWWLIMPADLDRADAAPAESGYLAQLREGWRFLIKDRLLLTVTLMIAVTNLLDIAKSSVLLPVWAVANGHGVATVGLLLTCFAVTAMISSLVASAVGSRLPRRVTYFVAFAVAGPPPFLVLGLDLPLWAIAVVFGIAGLAAGFLNPMLGAIFFERIPQPLLGRVGGTRRRCLLGRGAVRRAGGGRVDRPDRPDAGADHRRRPVRRRHPAAGAGQPGLLRPAAERAGRSCGCGPSRRIKPHLKP